MNGSSNTVGSILRLYCDDGYRLQGADELICTAEGSWDKSAAECHSKIIYHLYPITCFILGTFFRSNGIFKVVPEGFHG